MNWQTHFNEEKGEDRYPKLHASHCTASNPSIAWSKYIDDIWSMLQFKAKIEIIGVNPYVLLPEKVLKEIFRQAEKDRGKIPVKMKIDGHEFIQTLIKYSGAWRLYLNTPMRNAAGKDVGDTATFRIAFDPSDRKIQPHPKLAAALKNNDNARRIFEGLSPSCQLEIVRYISFLKTEESVDKNVAKAIRFLTGTERFIGRDGYGE